ncbi:MAG: hypothetical protein JNM27_01505 [Leptospirales bacterium]|nr:hypothetical protein [Leptospirales bacterium]
MQRSFHAPPDANSPGIMALCARLTPTLTFVLVFSLQCHLQRQRDGFIIEGSPSAGQIDNLARTGENWSRFFPMREPIRIVFRSASIPAAYDSRKKVIGLDPNAKSDSARHELAHALLDLNRPDTPYWLHEGLAYFLESNAAACGSNASIPQWLIDRLTSGKIDLSDVDLKSWESVDLSSRERAIQVAARSSAFVLFVWQKGQLERFLKTSYQTRQLYDVPAALQWPNDWQAEFRTWLRRGEFRRALAGC